MAERSPNFPSMPLGEALDAIKLIYKREGRAKMPRLSAVKPLGYTSINGRSLSVLGALRAFGLLEGRGDDVKVSDDALTIINAPEGSVEKREAIIRCFEAPAAFALLRSKGDASPDTLRWHLIKANFLDGAADKLLKVYLASNELVNAALKSCDLSTPSPDVSGGEPLADPARVGDAVRWEAQGVVQFEGRRVLALSDDGEWAFVEGSSTGVPMTELTVIERAPPMAVVPPSAPKVPPLSPSWRSPSFDEPDFVVKLGEGIVALINIKGGEAEARHLKKLGRFIKLQEELLGEDDSQIDEESG